MDKTTKVVDNRSLCGNGQCLTIFSPVVQCSQIEQSKDEEMEKSLISEK